MALEPAEIRQGLDRLRDRLDLGPSRSPMGPEASTLIAPAPSPKPNADWRAVVDLVALAVSVAAFGLALLATWFASEGNKLAAQALQDQRIASSWQILSTTSGGAAKRYAIESLVELTDNLEGVDVSCPEKFLVDEPPFLSCASPPFLRGLTLVGDHEPPEIDEAGFGRVDGTALAGSRFYLVNLRDLVARNVLLSLVDFTGSDLGGARFESVELSGVTFDDASIYGVSFANSVLEAVSFSSSDITDVDFSSAQFGSVNISGAWFCSWSSECNATIDQRFFDAAWFWADDPPKDLFQYSRSFRVQAGCPRPTNPSNGSPDRCYGEPVIDLRTVIPNDLRRSAR